VYIQDHAATVVSVCQKFFRVLPVTYRIDIRTATFSGKIYIHAVHDNSKCMVFKRHALIGINRIYSTYTAISIQWLQSQSWNMLLTNYILTA